MSWLFSQALVGEFSERNCLAGERSAQSKSKPIELSGYASDKTKAFFRPFRSGTETFLFSMADHGEDLLTWFRAGSHARISARPILTLSELPVSVQDSGKKCPESLAKWDRNTSSWRTPHNSQAVGSTLFSGTWPKWGSMRSGECWALMTSARFTGERESSFSGGVEKWPTVTASIGGPNTNSKSVAEEGHGNNLQGAVTLWPTVLESEHKASKSQAYKLGDQFHLAAAVEMWPTATVCGNYNRVGVSVNSGDGLATAVKSWPQGGELFIDLEALTLFGVELKSSHAGTENLGQLSPDFAEWLQGFPIGWTGSAPLETRRSLRSWLPCGKSSVE